MGRVVADVVPTARLRDSGLSDLTSTMPAMAAAAHDGPGGLLRALTALRRRRGDQPTTSPSGGPEEDAAEPSDRLPDERTRPLLLPLAVAAFAGVLLSVLRSPFVDAASPFRWPPAALGVSDTAAVQGVLTAVILGAVLEGRGATDRIDALRREGAAALRAEETSLVRRYERATGLSWAVASLATVIGTTSVVAVFPGGLFAAVMISLLTVLVVSLSSFVSTTSREARVALQRENDRRRQREVRVLRTVESRWRSSHRPHRRHGTPRVVVAVAPCRQSWASLVSPPCRRNGCPRWAFSS